jgi:hypothetical protein
MNILVPIGCSYGAFTKVYLNYAFFLSFHIWSPKWVLATGMATHPSITFWSPKLDRPGSRGSGRHQATGVFAGRWRHRRAVSRISLGWLLLVASCRPLSEFPAHPSLDRVLYLCVHVNKWFSGCLTADRQGIYKGSFHVHLTGYGHPNCVLNSEEIVYRL